MGRMAIFLHLGSQAVGVKRTARAAARLVRKRPKPRFYQAFLLGLRNGWSMFWGFGMRAPASFVEISGVECAAAIMTSAIGTSGGRAAETLEPFITGPAGALWAGFGAFVVIFVLMLLFVIQRRVVKPAAQNARDANFFEPAGEDAEITFDDPADLGEPEKPRKKRKKEKKENRRRGEKAAGTLDIGELGPGSGPFETADEPGSEPEPERRKTQPAPREGTSAFAGIFSKKKRAEAEEEAARAAHHDDARQEEPETPPFAAPATYRQSEWIDAESEELDAPAPPAERASPTPRRGEANGADRRDADNARRFEEENEERRRAAFLHAENEAVFERRKAEAALEQRMQSLALMQRKLTEQAETISSDTEALRRRLDASVSQRFSQLGEDLEKRFNSAIERLQPARQNYLDADALRDLSEAVAGEIDKLRASNASAIEDLSARMGALEDFQRVAGDLIEEMRGLSRRLGARASPAVGGRLQLGDVVRNALPADRFRLSHKLSTGAVADCLVLTPDGGLPFAVDAGFPAELYDRYARADEDARPQAELAYRRGVLRHMVEISEQMNAAEETADFSVMFVPSDAIFNDLYANFQDLVQDSYRARIWLVSPTSLMATLHMMATATSGSREMMNASERERELERTIAALGGRVEALEASRAEHAPERAPEAFHFYDDDFPPSAEDFAFDGAIEFGGVEEETGDDERGGEGGDALAEKAAAPSAPRPAFPLRTVDEN